MTSNGKQHHGAGSNSVGYGRRRNGNNANAQLEFRRRQVKRAEQSDEIKDLVVGSVAHKVAMHVLEVYPSVTVRKNQRRLQCSIDCARRMLDDDEDKNDIEVETGIKAVRTAINTAFAELNNAKTARAHNRSAA